MLAKEKTNVAVKDIIINILRDTHADCQAHALPDLDLVEHCRSQGLTDIDVIETELYSLIADRKVYYFDEGEGALSFWIS